MSIILDARTATDHFPGIGRYVVNLARVLAPLAPHLNLTLLHDPTATVTRLSLPDLPTVNCAVSPFSFSQQWQVPGVLRHRKAKLYHSPYYLMPYWPGLPTIVTCYDVIPLRYPAYFSAAQRLIFWLAHRLALNTARVVLAISEATQADLIRFFHLDVGKVVVTPLAADEHFQPQSPARLAVLRQAYGLPEQYVLYFGSNKPHKNLVRLVQAFGKSQPIMPLIIAGHWDSRYPEAKALVERSDWQGRVKFIGPMAEVDLPALYSGAQLFVFPSLYEGFGLPVLEAMACGAPVACSNTSSLSEVVGDSAVMFNPLEVDAIAASIQRLLSDRDLRDSLRPRGLERAAEFTWERAARQTAEVYRSLVGTAS